PARCRQHLAGAVRLVRGSWSPNAASKSWGHSPLRAGRGNFSDTRVPSLVPKRLAAAPDGSLSLSERERVRVRVRFGCIDSARRMPKEQAPSAFRRAEFGSLCLVLILSFELCAWNFATRAA